MNQEKQITDSLAHEFALYMQQYSKLYQDFAQNITSYVKTSQKITIVEIGSGPGLLIKELLELIPKCSIIGIEPNQAMIQEAIQVLQPYYSRRYMILEKSIEHTSLSDESVEAVVSRFSVYAWKHPKQIMKELHRILKPGGIIIFEMLNKEFPQWKRQFVKLNMRRKCAKPEVIEYHIRSFSTAYTHQQIRDMLAQHGFQKIFVDGGKNAWKFQVHAYKPA